MTSTAFLPDLAARLQERAERHVAADATAGVSWWVERHGEVVAGAAGGLHRGGGPAAAVDTLYRIASITKPVVAVAALTLVEDCTLRLDEPLDDLLPELVDRPVLLDRLGPVDGPTEPLRRPLTLHDVLTNRMGWGMDFSAPWPQAFLEAASALDLAPAEPSPAGNPDPDTWMARMATLPLLTQPGERWLYNTASDVLGVLVARAAGEPLDQVVAERVFEPLGLRSTGFSTSALGVGAAGRLGTSYGGAPAGQEHPVVDGPEGQWSTTPAFPSGASGLLSTVEDLAAFGRMLLADGRGPDGGRVLAPATVAAMTTDQLGRPGRPDHADTAGAVGWGFGVGVQTRRVGPARAVGSYGWDGGLGSTWLNDPATGLTVVALSTDTFTGAEARPAVLEDVLTTVATHLA